METTAGVVDKISLDDYSIMMKCVALKGVGGVKNHTRTGISRTFRRNFLSQAIFGDRD
jgi:hypothetical protein